MKVYLPSGVTINYLERGTPAGLPVVFIHGFPFSHRMWDAQMRTLPHGIRAISYDLRGHGESQVADGQYTIEFLVDDLIALLDHLVIDKAVLCGLSMGGYVALRAIERHPERVRALVLADTRSEADPNEGKVKRSATIMAVKRDGVPAFAETFVKAVFAPQNLTGQPQAVEFIKSIIRGNTQLGIAGTLVALAARTDTTALLGSIGVPTLIMVGEHDTLTPPSASESMHKAIKGSQLVVIPGAGHLSNLENETAFNQALVAFLKQV